MNGPCSWPVVYADCGDDGTPALPTDPPPEVRVRAETMATAYLWNWTRQQFGLCEEIVRPCREDCHRPSTWKGAAPQWRPVLLGGQWFNLTCGSCPPPISGGCSCVGDETTAIRLPGPIHSVESILVDGTLLPETAYRVDDRSILVRVDGGVWPDCQNLNDQPTEPGTWQVTYTRGTPVPEGGQVAAGVLASEFVKALCDDNSCRLPRRVQSITRQGVSMAILDAFEDMEKGHTGIWVIDSWVASVTVPNRRGGTVVSPDVNYRRPVSARRTTWSAN